MLPTDVKKETEKEAKSRRMKIIAVSGAMIMLPAASIGYTLFGLINGLGVVVMIGGVMLFLQTQIESAANQIEIKINQD